MLASRQHIHRDHYRRPWLDARGSTGEASASHRMHRARIAPAHPSRSHFAGHGLTPGWHGRDFSFSPDALRRITPAHPSRSHKAATATRLIRRMHGRDFSFSPDALRSHHDSTSIAVTIGSHGLTPGARARLQLLTGCVVLASRQRTSRDHIRRPWLDA